MEDKLEIGASNGIDDGQCALNHLMCSLQTVRDVIDGRDSDDWGRDQADSGRSWLARHLGMAVSAVFRDGI
jgi:hypothetical protein